MYRNKFDKEINTEKSRRYVFFQPKLSILKRKFDTIKDILSLLSTDIIKNDSDRLAFNRLNIQTFQKHYSRRLQINSRAKVTKFLLLYFIIIHPYQFGFKAYHYNNIQSL